MKTSLNINRTQVNKLTDFFREEYHSLKAYVKGKIDWASDSDPDDIVQDVALRIFSRGETATPIDNIAGFVYSALRNRIVDVLRGKNIGKATDALEDRWLELAEQFADGAEGIYTETLARELAAAVDRLKPSYKEVIMAIDYGGFTYKELARASGTSMGTLMSRRHRAIAQLHKALENKIEMFN